MFISITQHSFQIKHLSKATGADCFSRPPNKTYFVLHIQTFHFLWKKKSSSSNHGRTDKQKPYKPKYIFPFDFVVCVEHLQDDKHSAKCCKVWWKMQNRLGHQISCLVHKEIYGYYLKINQFIKANKNGSPKKRQF